MKFTVALAATLVLTATACSSGEDPDAGPPTPATSSSPPAVETPLEGTWTTDLERAAVRGYIRKQGWGREAERVMLSPDMAGPEETRFRIDFVGDRFRMAQVSSDEQWQSGTFEIEDGRIVLDDEAPVGVLTFRFTLDGDFGNLRRSQHRQRRGRGHARRSRLGSRGRDVVQHHVETRPG